MAKGLIFNKSYYDRKHPIIIAGPCMAESMQLLDEVGSFLNPLAKELGFEWVFKASFDKANRSSSGSMRGPGMSQALEWMGRMSQKFHCKILTDIHESHQAQPVAEVCDVLQIPAFLCRQSDLIAAAVATGRAVNIKKGQFLAPASCGNIVQKAREVAEQNGRELDLGLCERGTSFGYGDLVVDMRSLPLMSATGAAVVFDVTHSLQRPATSSALEGVVSGGAREFAPSLTRAAIASGYVDALFLEVHPQPSKALSDAATQLSFVQAEALLRQVVPLLKSSGALVPLDHLFRL